MSKIKKMLVLELGILLLVLIVFIVTKYEIFTIFPKCMLNQYLGIQCPACGATRCVTNFILGNWDKSISYHPVFFFTIWYLIFVNIIYIYNCIRDKNVLKWIYPKFHFWIIWTIILIFFAIIRNIV